MKTTRNVYRWLTGLAVAVLAIGCSDQQPTSPESAQTVGPAFSLRSSSSGGLFNTDGGGNGDDLIHACYMPGSGMIYRINADGLKEGCNGEKHVEFSWNVGLSFAGQSCEAGEFVAGFDASGHIICAVPGGEPPQPPPPPPPPPSPPLITGVLITPEGAMSDNDLTCTATISGVGQHTYRFDWFIDGDQIRQEITTATQDVLLANETASGNEIRCDVAADNEVPVSATIIIQ